MTGRSAKLSPVGRQLPRALTGVAAVLLLAIAAAAGRGTEPNQSPDVVTAHYSVHSDLDEATTRDLADELERCWTEYDLRLGRLVETKAAGDRYDVRLFASKRDYLDHHGGDAPATSAGLFDSRSRQLTGYLGDGGRGELRRTLRHEAFHQFAYETLGPGLPLWVNEGLAQIFEHGVPAGDRFVLGEVPPVPLLVLRRAMEANRLVDFGEMLAMKQREWARRMEDPTAGVELYAQAWAMTHFLAYAADAEGRPLYRDRFNAFLADVAAGTPAEAAFRRHFGTNTAGFRGRFEAYVAQLRPTPVMQEIDRHDTLARMIALLGERGSRFATPDELRRFVIANGFRLYRDNDGIRRASPADPSSLFADARGRPLEGAQLRFELDLEGELPALVTRPGDGYVYRTRFYRHGDQTLHETAIDVR